jgi:hypothetical protein
MPPELPAFTILAEFWGLPAPLRRRLWQALSSARWSRATAWRVKLGMFTSLQMTPATTFMFTMCAPGDVITIIEDLYKERRLDRRSASSMQEYVLARTNRHCKWRGDPYEAEGDVDGLGLGYGSGGHGSTAEW